MNLRLLSMDAADLSQEILVTSLEAETTGTNPEEAISRRLEALRSSARRQAKRQAPRSTLDNATAKTASPVDVAVNREVWEIAKDTLSPREFMILHLRLQLGYTSQEVATKMSLSVRAVINSKAKALNKLRKKLATF